MALYSTPATWAGGGYDVIAGRSASSRDRAYRVDNAMIRRAPRCTAGETGAVSRMPPSPYHRPSISTAGKKKGSDADAMTWSTDSVQLTLLRCGRSHV